MLKGHDADANNFLAVIRNAIISNSKWAKSDPESLTKIIELKIRKKQIDKKKTPLLQ